QLPCNSPANMSRVFIFSMQTSPISTLSPYTTLFRSKEHLQGKELLYSFFSGLGIESELEVYLPELKQRPDIFLPGYGVAIEFQRSEEHTSELQSRVDLVCRLLLEKKKNAITSEQYTF